MNTISTMQAQWKALKLELLTPVKLTDEDFEIILEGRKNPIGRLFRSRMPLVVARFKSAAKREIMEHARKHSKRVVSMKYSRLYHSDIKKINKVLFGTICIKDTAGVALGYYRKPVIRNVHVDSHFLGRKLKRYKVAFIARIGALPTLYIRGQDELTASKDTRNLIKQSRLKISKKGRRARQTLIQREILLPLPLGDVAMIVCSRVLSRYGTLHCSSPVPRKGKRSAIFYCLSSPLG